VDEIGALTQRERAVILAMRQAEPRKTSAILKTARQAARQHPPPNKLKKAR
jgi:hypothetical protein